MFQEIDKMKRIKLILGVLVIALAVTAVLLLGKFYVRDVSIVDGIEVETTKSYVGRLTWQFYISTFAMLLIILITNLNCVKELKLKHYLYLGLYVLQGIVFIFFAHWGILLTTLVIIGVLEFLVFKEEWW